jgi:hypothetical protein
MQTINNYDFYVDGIIRWLEVTPQWLKITLMAIGIIACIALVKRR